MGMDKMTFGLRGLVLEHAGATVECGIVPEGYVVVDTRLPARNRRLMSFGDNTIMAEYKNGKLDRQDQLELVELDWFGSWQPYLMWGCGSTSGANKRQFTHLVRWREGTPFEVEPGGCLKLYLVDKHCDRYIVKLREEVSGKEFAMRLDTDQLMWLQRWLVSNFRVNKRGQIYKAGR